MVAQACHPDRPRPSRGPRPTRLAPALLVALLAVGCDEGRHLVGVLTMGPTGSPGAGGAGGGTMGQGGAGAVMGGVGGRDVPPPMSPLCQPSMRPQPVRMVLVDRTELAHRLSRLFFAEPADPVLIARTAHHATSADVQTMARILLGDPRARRGVNALMERWLGLGPVRDAAARALMQQQITPELYQSLIRETPLFTEHLFFEGDGLLRTLLTASHTFADRALAELYGVSGPAPGSFSRIDVDPNQRSGVLTHAAFMLANPRATARGVWLRDALLCQAIPPPPPNVPTALPPPTMGKTSRQALEELTAGEPACAACHQLVDPPGFAFEHFDRTGRWRETENGVPVSASGYLTNVPSGGGLMFAGAPSLGQGLAALCDVQRCAAQTFLRHALDQSDPEVRQEELTELWSAFFRSGFDLRELMVAVTGAESFLSP